MRYGCIHPTPEAIAATPVVDHAKLAAVALPATNRDNLLGDWQIGDYYNGTLAPGALTPRCRTAPAPRSPMPRSVPA